MLSARTRAAYAAAAAYAGAGGPGVRRTVTIVGLRQIAMVNFDLLMEFELTALPDGLPPYRPPPSSWSARGRRGS